MKLKRIFNEVKTALQFKTPRMRFIGLELFLGTLFVVGYSIIEDIFLQGRPSVSTYIDPTIYLLYFVCMMILFVVLALMFFFGGMYFHKYIFIRSAKQMMKDMAENPLGLLLKELEVDE
jgi:hypothetical protein